jgi:hypothetical protein
MQEWATKPKGLCVAKNGNLWREKMRLVLVLAGSFKFSIAISGHQRHDVFCVFFAS